MWGYKLSNYNFYLYEATTIVNLSELIELTCLFEGTTVVNVNDVIELQLSYLYEGKTCAVH